MRTLIILLRKDAANFLRDRTAFSLTFLVPIALIYIFGFVFGLNGRDSGPAGIRIAVVNLSAEPGAQTLVKALQAEKAFRVVTTRTLADKTEVPLTEADLRPLMRQNAFRFALVIPAELLQPNGIGIRLTLLSNPRNDIETQTVNGLLQKTLFTSVPDLLGRSLQAQAQRVLGEERLAGFNRALAGVIGGAFGGEPEAIERSIATGDFGLSRLGGDPAPESGAPNSAGRSGGLESLVRLDTEQVIGANVKSPEATRVVGGWAVMFLLFALSGTATAFFEEKKTGIFQRLLAAPVSRAQLLGSRFLFGVLLGLIQLLTLFLAGRVLYGIDVFGNLGNLVVVAISAAAACTAFGIFLVSITSTAAAASGLATFLVLVMSACGGAWFPLSFMPPLMQEIARFTLVYWAIEGFTQVLWAQQTLVEILPTVAVLLAIAGVVMSLAIWRFNRGRLFE